MWVGTGCEDEGCGGERSRAGIMCGARRADAALDAVLEQFVLEHPVVARVVPSRLADDDGLLASALAPMVVPHGGHVLWVAGIAKIRHRIDGGAVGVR